MELQKLNELTPSIVQAIFKILHKYATPGMATVNENCQLIKNAFGAMVAVIRNEQFALTEDQLRTLLVYIDQSIGDSSNQVHGFAVLKVILDKQLVVSEIHDIMRRISEMAITSESNVTRTEAKRLLISYLLDYPLGTKIDGYITFFVTNLDYATISGRDASIQILHKIVNRFPQDIVHENSPFLFVCLGTKMTGDESPECRKSAAACIESLITRCDESHQDKLFDVAVGMLKDKKNVHIELGAMLCTRFVEVEKSRFVKRIEQVMELLIDTLPLSKHKGPGRYVRLRNNESDDSDDEMDENKAKIKQDLKKRSKDHKIFQVTNAILQIIEKYQSQMANYKQNIYQLAYESQKMLDYEHVWVRINAAKILGFILSQIDVEQLKLRFSPDNTMEPDLNFLFGNPATELKSLCLDLTNQLIPEATDEDMADIVVNNLLYVANMIKDVSLKNEPAVKFEDRIINLTWLIKQMCRVVNAEVAKAPHIIILVSYFFHQFTKFETLIKILFPANSSFSLD